MRYFSYISSHSLKVGAAAAIVVRLLRTIEAPAFAG